MNKQFRIAVRGLPTHTALETATPPQVTQPDCKTTLFGAVHGRTEFERAGACMRQMGALAFSREREHGGLSVQLASKNITT